MHQKRRSQLVAKTKVVFAEELGEIVEEYEKQAEVPL
jgi:hypothetical protein